MAAYVCSGQIFWAPNLLSTIANPHILELWHLQAALGGDFTVGKFRRRCHLAAMELHMLHMSSICLEVGAHGACIALCTPSLPLPLNLMGLCPATLISLAPWRTPFPPPLSRIPSYREISNRLSHPGFLAAPGLQKFQLTLSARRLRWSSRTRLLGGMSSFSAGALISVDVWQLPQWRTFSW